MSSLPDLPDEEQAVAPRERLKLVFLVPLALVIAAITVLLLNTARIQQNDEFERRVRTTNASMREFFEQSVAQGTDTLGAVLAAIKANRELDNAFARHDRDTLLRHAAPIMEALRTYGISHWYFNDPQSVNLLRVHAPELYGDTITRATAVQATRTGKAATGVELGRRGMFTLRVVEPWYGKNGRLFGYVELGSGIEVVLDHMEQLLGTPLYLLTRKDYLSAEVIRQHTPALEDGQGGAVFPEFLVAHGEVIPEPLAQQLRVGFPRDGQVFSFEADGRSFRAVAMWVADAAGRPVAAVLAVIDVTGVVRAGRRALLRGGAVGVFAGGLLLGLFYWLLNGIERRLEGHEARLRELATRDALTGLLNRRSFYTRIGIELRRAARYGRPLSLLLIDIDYFKAVNDNYGHKTGDEVLAEIARRIQAAIRVVDTAFRYGGEELVVLLPETPLPDALEIAERIRADIAERPFASTEGETLSLSVSIGGASYPEYDSVDALVSAADRAMYSAKAAGRNQVCCARGSA